MGLATMKHFTHTGSGTFREMFLCLGHVIKNGIVEKVNRAHCYGLLIDEVTDVSVINQMVSFIQHYEANEAASTVHFLAVADVLRDSDSANSETLYNVVKKMLADCDIPQLKLTSLVTDGASVMMGKTNGVAAKLKRDNPALLNLHCICHRLALACADTNNSVKIIKDVELYLVQLWKFFDDSPKRSAALTKTQVELDIVMKTGVAGLSSKSRKLVTKKVKKACRTRWLSLEKAVEGVSADYVSITQTLRALEKDPMAVGLLKKLDNIRCLSVIYILKFILPHLGKLSKTFQRGTIHFSSIAPCVSSTRDALTALVDSMSPVLQLENDLKADGGRLSHLQMSITSHQLLEMRNLLTKYVSALLSNISARFEEALPCLTAFSIFDPLCLPTKDSEAFRIYGVDQVNVIANQFLKDEGGDTVEQLHAEWGQFKYQLDTWRAESLVVLNDPLVCTTSTEFALQRLMSLQTAFGYCYPLLVRVAEIILSMPVSNAWPERGASAVKRLKTRLRSSLKNDMLEALMHVSINGPSVQEADVVIEKAVEKWQMMKQRRKLPKHGPPCVGSPRIILPSSNNTKPMTTSGSDHASVEDLNSVLTEAETMVLFEERLHLPAANDDDASDNDSADDDEHYDFGKPAT